MATQAISERLHQAEVAIDNALADAPILEALTAFGYDRVRLEAARALYAEVVALSQAQKVAYGRQFEATQTMETAWKEAKAAYMRTLKVARVAFDGNAKAKASLVLNGSRKQNFAGWLEQATALYQNLLNEADLLAAISSFGYDEVKITAEAAAAANVETLNLTQERAKGDAQAATQSRDTKLAELDKWMADFKKIALLALADTPQTLEKLGFNMP